MFVSIGMEAFARRARRELLATGETVRRRAVEVMPGDSRRQLRDVLPRGDSELRK
jgi:hypothetical protein